MNCFLPPFYDVRSRGGGGNGQERRCNCWDTTRHIDGRKAQLQPPSNAKVKNFSALRIALFCLFKGEARILIPQKQLPIIVFGAPSPVSLCVPYTPEFIFSFGKVYGNEALSTSNRLRKCRIYISALFS
jgi:hypothetical protein